MATIGALKIGLLLLEHGHLRLSLNTTLKLPRKLLWVHHVTVNLIGKLLRVQKLIIA